MDVTYSCPHCGFLFSSFPEEETVCPSCGAMVRKRDLKGKNETVGAPFRTENQAAALNDTDRHAGAPAASAFSEDVAQNAPTSPKKSHSKNTPVNRQKPPAPPKRKRTKAGRRKSAARIVCMILCTVMIAGATSTALYFVFRPDFSVTADGVLYEYHGKKRNVRLPNNVSVVAPRTFCNNKYLVELDLNGASFVSAFAFFGCPSLKSVRFSADALTSLDAYSFANCSALTELDLSEGVSYASKTAFFGCSDVRRLVLPEMNETFGSTTVADLFSGPVDVASPNSFSLTGTPRQLSEIVYLGETVPDYFAENVTTLSDFSAPNAKSVGKHALSGCTALVNVDLPFATANLAENCFAGTGITYVKDGFSMKGNTLTAYDAKDEETELLLPAYVTEIGEGAFSGALLTKITLSSSLEKIGSLAFSDCENLSEVLLPEQSNLTFVAIDAFLGAGTEPEFPESVRRE